MRKYVKSSPGSPQLFVFCILGVVRLYFSALHFVYLYFVYVCLSRVLYFYVHLCFMFLYSSLFWVFTYLCTCILRCLHSTHLYSVHLETNMADDEDDNEERRLSADERYVMMLS